MRLFHFAAVLGLLAVSAASAHAIDFIEFIKYPGSTSIAPTGISGNRIVGYYDMDNRFPDDGFIYEGGTWTTVTYPGGAHTVLTGISGQNMVGFYDFTVFGGPAGEYGAFLYDGTTFTKITIPNVPSQARPEDILNGIVVGSYNALNLDHGFILADGLVRTIDYPGAMQTRLLGIAGPNKYLGAAQNSFSESVFGFIVDNGVFTPLPKPPGINEFYYNGIDGDVVVGSFYDTGQGFIYSGGTYTTVGPIVLGSGKLIISDIEGNKIVGFRGEGDNMTAFIAIIPEPSTYTIALIGLAGLAASRRCKFTRSRLRE